MLFEGITEENWQHEASVLFPSLQASVDAGQALRVVILTASGCGSELFNQDLLLFAVDNIVKELLRGETLRHQHSIVMIESLKFAGDDTFAIQQAVTLLETQLKCTMFAAVGQTVTTSMSSVNLGKQRTMRIRSSICRIRVTSSRSTGLRIGQAAARCARLRRSGSYLSFCTWAMLNNCAGVKKIVDRELSIRRLRLHRSKGFLQWIVVSGHRWLERAGAEVSEKVAQESQIYGEFDFSQPLEEQLHHRLQALLTHYNLASDTPESTIKRAKAYIIEHLHDKHLSLRDVASQVHWNATHFSEVFKRGPA